MSFPRYPSYKDSGVEWLGQVPGHWDVKRLKHVAANIPFAIVDGPFGTQLKAEDYRETGVPLVRISNLSYEGRFSADDLVFIEESKAAEVERSTVLKGDIVIGKTGATIGKTALFSSFERGIIASSCLKITPNRSLLSSRFLLSVIVSGSFQKNLVNESGGSTRDTINITPFGNLPIAVPPLPDQTAIAEFLDRETGKIDELVAEQRRLMELLKEKRQAVISHAVTRGLNPAAPLKPSGIEWLGDVPAHWRIGKLGHASKLRGGFAFSAADFGAEGIVVVRMNNLKRGRLDLSEAARIPESSCNEGAALSDGDLIWGMSGSTGETGSLGNYARVRSEDLPCQLNQRVGRFAANPARLDLDFLEQVIQTAYFYEQIMLLVTGTAQFNVSSEQVQSCLVALPPVSEQSEIVAYLGHETAKLDALTAEAQRAIDLLQERRTALISAAVTGQIDVRAT